MRSVGATVAVTKPNRSVTQSARKNLSATKARNRFRSTKSKMDIESLIGGLDPNNPAQVKALQQALQARGYDVTPDGKLGGKTSAAIGKYRSDQNEVANRSFQGKQLEQRSQEQSWQNQATQAAKYAAIPLGMYAGHRMGKGIEKRQMATEAAQRAGVLPNAPMGWGSVRRSVGRMTPYAGAGAFFGGEGYLLRNQVADQIPNETGKEFARLGGSASIGAGIGIAGHGLKGAFQPQVAPGAPFGGAPNLPMGPGAAALAPPRPMGGIPPIEGLLPPGAPPPAAPPPLSQTPLRRPSDRLVSAARAAGATGKMTKVDAADWLAKNITAENRTAAAAELGVKSGPNFAERISNRIKLLKTSTKPLSIGLPLAVGVGAYGMGSSEAEAAGATPEEARAQGGKDAAAAAGGAGAGMWALNKLPSLARTLGRMSGPMMLNDAAVELHRRIYGSGPQHLNVPERNPNRSVLTGQDSGPMASASALHVPEGIPLPQPDGSSPYGELPSAFGMPPMPMRRPRF